MTLQTVVRCILFALIIPQMCLKLAIHLWLTELIGHGLKRHTTALHVKDQKQAMKSKYSLTSVIKGQTVLVQKKALVREVFFLKRNSNRTYLHCNTWVVTLWDNSNWEKGGGCALALWTVCTETCFQAAHRHPSKESFHIDSTLKTNVQLFDCQMTWRSKSFVHKLLSSHTHTHTHRKHMCSYRATAEWEMTASEENCVHLNWWSSSNHWETDGTSAPKAAPSTPMTHQSILWASYSDVIRLVNYRWTVQKPLHNSAASLADLLWKELVMEKLFLLFF